jgi:hypothetical protein
VQGQTAVRSVAVMRGASGMRPTVRVMPVDLAARGMEDSFHIVQVGYVRLDPRPARLHVVRIEAARGLQFVEALPQSIPDGVHQDLLDLVHGAAVDRTVCGRDRGAEILPGGLKAGVGGPFALAVDPDDHLEEEAVSQKLRVGAEPPHTDRVIEGVPDLRLVLRADPEQHVVQVVRLQRLLRGTDYRDDAARRLVPKGLPTFTQDEKDAADFRSAGFGDTHVLGEATTFAGITLSKTPGRHEKGGCRAGV